MTRGRKPKPTRLKLLQGNPGKRPLNDGEPQPKAGRPRIPPHIRRDSVAKACWEWLIREMEAMHTLTTADAKLLEMFAAVYARWRRAMAFVEKHGMTYVIKSSPKVVQGKLTPGEVKAFGQYPQVSIVKQAEQRLESLAAELGLSPASRTRIKIAKPMGAENPVIAAMLAARARRGISGA